MDKQNKSAEEIAKEILLKRGTPIEVINSTSLSHHKFDWDFTKQCIELAISKQKQSNALLKAEMESWKTEHFETVEMAAEKITGLEQANAELQVDLQFFKNSQRLNEEQVQHQYNKIAELKQELSDKDTAYILTKNTLIRRTKKLKELEKQNAELSEILKIFYEDIKKRPLLSVEGDQLKERTEIALKLPESNKQP